MDSDQLCEEVSTVCLYVVAVMELVSSLVTLLTLLCPQLSHVLGGTGGGLGRRQVIKQ